MAFIDQQPTGSTRYEQRLARVINVIGNICITVSGITPAASLFIIVPVALTNQASGAFLAFVIAAIIGVGMAMCYGELGSVFPIVGGQYSIVSRVLGRPTGFIAFANFLALALFIPSALALGAGQYVSILFPQASSANLVGVIVLLFTTLIALFSIRFNALVTGIFLAMELLAVTVVIVLGFANLHQPMSILFSPLGSDGQPLPLGLLIAGVALGIFAYNGYDGAIVFSEETTGPRRGIAKAIFWALFITVAAELIPLTATLLGAPSLQELTTSSTPMAYFLTALGGPLVTTLVTVGVLLAIFNGNIAIMLAFGRILYSSGRDKAWPLPVSKWLGSSHSRLKSPVIATAVVGVVSALLTSFSNVAQLVTFTGVLLVVLYGLVALCALVSRYTQKELVRPFKMLWWPLWPLLGLVGCIIVLIQQTLTDIAICAALSLVAGLYYLFYLRPRKDTHWVMLKAIDDEPLAPKKLNEQVVED